MNKEKSLKLSIKCLLVWSLFIPLFFSQYFFFSFVTTKTLAFRLIVELSFILFVLYFFLKKNINFNKSLLWWWFLGLTAIILLAGLFGVNPYNSFWSNIERAEGGFFWIHLFKGVFMGLLFLF